MKIMTKKKLQHYIGNMIKGMIAILMLSPVYIMFTYSMKDKIDIMYTGLEFPKKLFFGNFIKVLQTSDMVLAMKNSVIAAVFMVTITVLASSMAAYIVIRKKTKFYNAMYYMFLGAIMLPFQVIMLPIYKVLYTLHIMNSLVGYIVALSGLQMSFSIFIISGFVKTVPYELEEAAHIDGAGKYRTFWTIVFPLMKPIIMTAVVIDALALWNDLIVAQIILQKNSLRTLTLAQYSYISQFSTDLGQAFAAFTISIIPMIIVYFCFQKYIIAGITAGAVKG